MSKRQEIDSELKEAQQINFAGSLEQDRNKRMFFIIEEAK